MDSTKERVAIEALFEQLRRAHAEHDSDAITEAYAPDAVIYDLVYRSTVFWTLSPLYSGSLCQAGRQLLLSNLRGRFVAMPPDKPCLIVALLKLQQRNAEFFHRIAGGDPQQVFFARADKTFGTPVAFSVNYTLHGVQANCTPIHWRLRSDTEEWTGTPSPPGLLGGKGQSGLMPAMSASPSKATWHSYPRSNRMRGRQGNEDQDMWYRTTVCLRKTDGRWHIVHDHTSVPFYMDGRYRAAVDLKP